MNTARLEAFSDGVMAVIITIMVLELKAPQGADLSALRAVLPTFLVYVLSFVFLGIYWVNHHHLMQVVDRIDGRTLWANIHLLFWLSLTPVATAWLGESGVETGPVAAYTIVLIGCGVAYTVLTLALLALHEDGSQLARAIGRDRKGKLSILLYTIALVLAFFLPWASIGFIVAVSVIWFIPDARVARIVAADGS